MIRVNFYTVTLYNRERCTSENLLFKQIWWLKSNTYKDFELRLMIYSDVMCFVKFFFLVLFFYVADVFLRYMHLVCGIWLRVFRSQVCVYVLVEYETAVALCLLHAIGGRYVLH
jgi:hypothetical protein